MIAHRSLYFSIVVLNISGCVKGASNKNSKIHNAMEDQRRVQSYEPVDN
jgi:hypothetical protein